MDFSYQHQNSAKPFKAFSFFCAQLGVSLQEVTKLKPKCQIMIQHIGSSHIINLLHVGKLSRIKLKLCCICNKATENSVSSQHRSHCHKAE